MPSSTDAPTLSAQFEAYVNVLRDLFPTVFTEQDFIQEIGVVTSTGRLRICVERTSGTTQATNTNSMPEQSASGAEEGCGNDHS